MPGHPHGATAGSSHRRGPFGRPDRRRAARARGGRGGRARRDERRPRATCSSSKIVAAARRTGAGAVHPWLRVSVREPGVRRRLRGRRHRLRRPLGGVDAGDGAEGCRQAVDARGRRAGRARLPRRGSGARQAGKAEADAIGYPVLIKARAGGGGKGMRRVDVGGRLRRPRSPRRGARRQASFGDEAVLIEKLIASPRHIEVQVFGDAHGRWCTCSSATARCSAATRRSSRRRPRPA